MKKIIFQLQKRAHFQKKGATRVRKERQKGSKAHSKVYGDREDKKERSAARKGYTVNNYRSNEIISPA